MKEENLQLEIYNVGACTYHHHNIIFIIWGLYNLLF
jgi:hypothetical protein